MMRIIDICDFCKKERERPQPANQSPGWLKVIEVKISPYQPVIAKNMVCPHCLMRFTAKVKAIAEEMKGGRG